MEIVAKITVAIAGQTNGWQAVEGATPGTAESLFDGGREYVFDYLGGGGII